LGVIIVCLAKQGAAPIIDPDTLWHILAGQHLAHTWDFAGPDPFSSFSHLPWVYNQWLPELGAAAAYHVGGLAGVLVLAQAARLALVGALYACARTGGGSFAAVVATIVAAVGVSGSVGPRPQLVGLILLALTVRTWMLTARDLRARWWLVPLTWVWACSHGTWVFGPAIGAVVTIGLVLDRRLSARRSVRLFAVAAASALTGLLTPAGFDLVRSMLAVQAVAPFISEWQRTTVAYVPAVVVLGAAAVTVLAWCRRGKVSWVSLLLMGVGIACVLLSLRTVAVGAVVLAPVIAAQVDRLPHGTGRLPGRREAVALATAMGLSLLLTAALVPSKGPLIEGFPSGMDRALDRLPAGSTVFDDSSVGGWLLWRHPSLRGMLDSRFEVFGPAVVKSYVDTVNAAPGWQARLAAAHPDAVLVRQQSPLAAALGERAGWRLLAQSYGYVLFQAVDAAEAP
jgi:hypothetical protein